jgi:hypothetical protein
MPYFETEVDVNVDEFWSACSRREKEELIDILEEDGLVTRTGLDEDELPSIKDLEWSELTNKLSQIRLRISVEDEEIISNILKKY